MPAGQAAVHGLTAGAILEVAEGLRWSDPQLSVALAEHVARTATDDPPARAAAERCAVLALGQLDRPAEVVVRALPHLRAAERAGREDDAAALRCEVALAAVPCGDAAAAETLLGPLAAGRALPTVVRADALVAWVAARAERGDVPGVDAAARQIADLVDDAPDPGAAEVRRVAAQRSRARARRVAGDPPGAAEVLLAVAPAATVADGGRQAALLAADLVAILGELGRAAEARRVGAPLLDLAPTAATAPALGRVRCALARAVHLPAGDLDAAERLAREAHGDLARRGHPTGLAEAYEVLAAVAERRGDARGVLHQLRRAHEHATSAHEDATRARVALAAALARPEDLLVPAGDGDEAAPGAGHGEQSAEDASALLAGPDPVEQEHAAGEAASTASLRATDPPVAEHTDTPPAVGPASEATVAPPRPPWAEAWPELPRWEDLGGGPDASSGAAPPLGAHLFSADGGAPSSVGSAQASERRPGQEPEPGSAADREVGRRRRRYREDPEPDGLLAAALAARAGLDALSTPVDEADPPSTGLDGLGSPPETAIGAAGETALGAAGETATAAGADGAATASGATPGSTTPDPGPGPTTAAAGLAADHVADALTAAGPPGTPDDVSGSTDLAAASRSRRLARARARWAAADPLLPRRNEQPRPDRDVASFLDDRRNGSGDGDGPSAGDEGHRAPSHGPRRDRQDDVGDVMTDRGTPGPGPRIETAAAPPSPGRPDQAPPRDARPAAPGGADDELARELALTLVDLLAEYQDPAVPLGGPGRGASAKPPQNRPASPSTGSTNGAAPRGGTPRPERPGASTARPADDPAPRLADLLAEAMDVYHRSGAGQAPVDDHPARR